MGMLSDEITTGDTLSGVPSRLMERDLRRITAKLQAGQPLSGAEQQAFHRHQAYQSQNTETVANAGIEATGVPGFLRAGGDMIDDPSLANATNLGVRGAVMAFKPLAAAKIAAAGYGAAAAKDAGVGLLSDAHAQDDGLTPEQSKRLQQLQSVISRAQWKSGAERRAVEDEAKGLRDIQAKFAEQNNAASINAKAKEKDQQQGEYDRTVQGAERARDAELARDKRFSDSEVGKVWDKTGVLTPFLAAIGVGGLSRAATGGGSRMKETIGPLAAGGGTGAVAANYPLIHNTMFTEPDNPQKRGYEAYARELPPTHPRREESRKYAEALPAENPVQAVARKELYDPVKLAERSGIGLVEGLLGGQAGSHLMSLPKRMLGTAAEVPGVAAAGYQRGMTGAAEAATERARQQAVLSEVQAVADAQRLSARNGSELAGGAPQAAVQAAPPTGGLLSPQGPAAMHPQPQPAPVQNQIPALPAPVKEPRQWAQIWSDPARAAITDLTTKGTPLSAVNATDLRIMIIERLPPGAPAPAASTVREYLANLKEAVPNASRKGLLTQFKGDPGRQVFGLGGPAIAAGGLGLLSMDQQ